MPRVRKRTPMRRAGLTEDERDFLADGWCLDGPNQVRWPSGHWSPFPDLEAARVAYLANKEVVHAAATERPCWAERQGW